MVLSGLGVSSTYLSPAQLYNLAASVGFSTAGPEPSLATTMAAIAMRESAGNPAATNERAKGTNSASDPGEHSYGLWQINTDANPQFSKATLLDPTGNAQAAFSIYAGNPNNLNIAWYINQPGYQQAYQQYIPVVEAAVGTQGGTIPLPAGLDNGTMTWDAEAGMWVLPDGSMAPDDGSGTGPAADTGITSLLTPMNIGIAFGLVALVLLWPKD